MLKSISVVLKSLLVILLFSVNFLWAQTLPDVGNHFLDKENRPMAFSTKDVVLSE